MSKIYKVDNNYFLPAVTAKVFAERQVDFLTTGRNSIEKMQGESNFDFINRFSDHISYPELKYWIDKPEG